MESLNEQIERFEEREAWNRDLFALFSDIAIFVAGFLVGVCAGLAFVDCMGWLHV